jgi:hypothetical protein
LSKGKQTESLKKEIKQLNNISDIGKEQKWVYYYPQSETE